MHDSAPSLRILPVARLAAGGRWRVEAMRASVEATLLWFTKGQGRITIAGQARGYTAHNAIFIPAGVMHGFEMPNGVFGQALFFGPDHGIALPDQPCHLRLRDVTQQQEVNMLLDHIQRELSSTQPLAGTAARHWASLLAIWLERQDRRHADAAPNDAARRLAARFTEALEAGFRSGKTIADFAEALHVTPAHLTRCCQIACGRPASALLQDRVLFEARRLLCETDMPVSRVAETLGFGSAAQFTRAFGHGTGATPTAFRRAV